MTSLLPRIIGRRTCFDLYLWGSELGHGAERMPVVRAVQAGEVPCPLLATCTRGQRALTAGRRFLWNQRQMELALR